MGAAFVQVDVSVVIPVYNAQKYLDVCLKSVVEQSLENLEIICVNDGSTDGSPAILRKYADRDKRVKIINKENSGYGASMNVGMDAAQGTYIGIVESDDIIDKEMFKTLFEMAVRYDLDIVKSDYYEFEENGATKYIKSCKRKPECYGQVINAQLVPEIFDFQMNTWTGIYRAEFLRENEIKHNETPGASFQDNGFWFQTLALAKRIMFIDEAFYRYRQDNPHSSINDVSKVYCMCDEYDFIEGFVENHPEVKELHMDAFIVKRYWNYMFSYERIATENKQPFLRRMASDFARHQKEIAALKDIHVRDILLRVIDDSELFYYEDTLWRLNELKKEKQDLLRRIRASNEMKRGKQLTGFAKKLLGRKT
jgi:glycosyltransferase involved in cell wall biosynthesis